MEDLKEVLRKEKEQGHAIILMMDANDSMGPNTALTRMAEEMELYDLHTS